MIGAHFIGANLGSAKLIEAQLIGTNFVESDLRRANFKGANLEGANLGLTNLKGTKFGSAKLNETILNNVDLSAAMGLNDCNHLGPSCVDYRTIARSKNVPLAFWRGCGLPDALIDYLPSLARDAIQFYSCFISYSSTDQEFADRLHADLQNAGVRCWFAPHDLPIGGDIRETIEAQIRLRDKVILILSEASVASAWVTQEVKTALEEEEAGRRILFPIRIDEAVMNTTDQWAHDIRRRRHIGDFTSWKDYDVYKATFARTLRDLKADA